MKIKSILACLALLSCLGMQGQDKKAQDQAASIKADDSYLWGEGFGETEASADQQALSQLMSKVSVTVSGQFRIDESEMVQDGQRDAQSVVRSVVDTYTAGALTNTGQLILQRSPSARVLRYVKRTEVERIFQEREHRIADYVRSAQTSERKGRIDDALRYYYWAACLTKSLQHPNETVYDDRGQRRLLVNWIPEQMDDIFADLKVEVSDVSDQVAQLYVTYQGRPVTSLDLRYWDGRNFSPLVSVKGGIAQVELPKGLSTENLRLRYEYEFKGRMQQDPELDMVMQMYKPTAFPKAEEVVTTGNRREQRQVQAMFQQAVASTADVSLGQEVERPKVLAQTVDRIVKAIREKKYDDVRELFTADGYQMFRELIRYGQATVLGNPKMTFTRMGNRTVCRSVPMSFAFKSNGRRTFTEDVTFTFNADGQVESLAFALDQATLADVEQRRMSGWSDSICTAITAFLENYKTAYALHRLDYLKSIFDKDAIIVVGHVAKRPARTVENQKYIDNQYVTLTRLSKEEYMRKLERCFDSNEYVNIRFSDSDLRKLEKKDAGELYGILLHQDYYSSTYADTGYLFLMVDMNQADQPTILVRTWQPRRDYSINVKMPYNAPYKGLIYGGNFQ